MNSRDIPSEQWPEVVDQFARLHQGKPVCVEFVDRHGKKRRLSDGQPFVGVMGGRGGRPSVMVMWGGQKDGAFGHSVGRPTRLSTAEWNDGYSGRLEIEGDDREKLIVRAGPEEQMLEAGIVMDGILLEKPS